MTLSEESWAWIDERYEGEKLGSTIRDVVEGYIILMQSQTGQLDIYEAIQRAQEIERLGSGDISPVKTNDR